MLSSSGLRSGKGSPYWTPTRRIAAAPASSAPSASHRLPHFGRGRPDQIGDVPGEDDHRVHARAFERGDLVARAGANVSDRELPCRDVLKKLQRVGERLVTVGMQDEHFGIELLENELEVFFLADPRGHLPVLGEVGTNLVQPLPVLTVDVDDAGVGRFGGRPFRVVDDQDRKLRRGADGSQALRRPARNEHALGAGSFCVARRIRALDADDDRDPVALGDRLAEPTLRHVLGVTPGIFTVSALSRLTSVRAAELRSHRGGGGGNLI